MDELSNDYNESNSLKLLRRLVTTLVVVMILGFLTLIIMLVIRLQPENTNLSVPANISLPNGEKATAFTQGNDWYAIVTENNQILIYDRNSGNLRQTVDIGK